MKTISVTTAGAVVFVIVAVSVVTAFRCHIASKVDLVTRIMGSNEREVL